MTPRRCGPGCENTARPPIERRSVNPGPSGIQHCRNRAVFPPLRQLRRIDKARRGAYLTGRPVPRRGNGRQAVHFRAFCRRPSLNSPDASCAAAPRTRGNVRPAAGAPRSQGTARSIARSERSKMLGTVLKKMFGSANDRRLKGYKPKVAEINALESEFAALTDDQLRAKTDEFRAELAAGKTFEDICAPAFAAVREAAKRTLKQRHFDVQLIGGLVLHEGAIAEMRTGEGKTLVATLAVYLNALAGKGVHVVTVNDYLARRDSRVDGRDLHVPRHDRRRHRPRARRRRAPRGLRRRHHLRHQQRIRLRLSARQHEIRHGADGPARAQLRHRRRGRLDPGRRGAHAADHLRPVGGPLRPLRRRSTS